MLKKYHIVSVSAGIAVFTALGLPALANPPLPSTGSIKTGAAVQGIPTQEELDKKEAELTNFPLMKVVKASVATRSNEVVEAVRPNNPTNPDNVKRVERLLSEAQFNNLFPLRAPEYTYQHFLQATAKFQAFCGDYTDGRNADAICRKSLATMFAHFAQETGAHIEGPIPDWRQALYHLREIGWDENSRNGYNIECAPEFWQSKQWPCGKFEDGTYKSYFGRGAKQLSQNYNYGPFSDAMFGNVEKLLNEPQLVADTWLNIASAIFFFTYPQPPKPSMLHVIDGTWQPNEHDSKTNGLTPGFGVTIQIINGNAECGRGGDELKQVQSRVMYYKEFANYFGIAISTDEVLGCANMKPFDAAGAGSIDIYWDQDWSWIPPNGPSYACELVDYQTPFSPLKTGDYSRCVQRYFSDK